MADDRPRTSLLFELFAATHSVRTLLNAAMVEAPLRPDEYAVYSVLFDRGASAPTSLARSVGMPATTMSHYVRAMVERGHVERVRNPADGRSVLLALTSGGRVVHGAAAQRFEEANIRFVAALGSPDPVLRYMLREIADAADVAATQLSADSLQAAG